MDALENVRIGTTAEKTVTVTPEMTVGHFVAYMPQVCATPRTRTSDRHAAFDFRPIPWPADYPALRQPQ